MRRVKVPRHVLVRDGPDDVDPAPAFVVRTERPVADEGQPSVAEAFERCRQSEHVLARRQRADAEKPGRTVRRRSHAEAVEIDPGGDDVGLPSRLGDLRLELAAEILGNGNHGGRTARHETGRRGDAVQGADIADVAPVRRHDERRARRQRGDQPRGDEKVRIDDVGAERASSLERHARERPVPREAAGAAVKHGSLDDVTAVGERRLEVADEDSEVRVGGTGIELRDEQDAHARILARVRITHSGGYFSASYCFASNTFDRLFTAASRVASGLSS